MAADYEAGGGKINPGVQRAATATQRTDRHKKSAGLSRRI
jgi:hypothetical protein